MTNSPTPRHHLIATVTGPYQDDLLRQITQTIGDCGCHILETRGSTLGGRTVLLARVDGEWNNLARLENALGRTARKLGLTLDMERVEVPAQGAAMMPFFAEIVGTDRIEILHKLALFFGQRRIALIDFATQSCRAPRTGTDLCTVTLTLGIPADLSLATLRDEFFDTCDQLNVDAVLEPVKN